MLRPTRRSEGCNAPELKQATRLHVVIETSIDELRTMATFVDYVIDSYEKLEVVMHLCRSRPRAVTARRIAERVRLQPTEVVDALVALERVGIVRKESGHDDTGWWLVPSCTWATTIDLMAQLYELDREALLNFMKLVAFESVTSKSDRRSLAFALFRRIRSRGPILS